MTLEAIKARIAEETSDSELYEKLARENPDYAGIFHDIAHEEHTHAKLLEHIAREIA